MNIMAECRQDAIKMNEELYPWDCMDILEKRYGRKLDNMKPITIYRKIIDLMGVLIDAEDVNEQDVVEVVNDWIGEI